MHQQREREKPRLDGFFRSLRGFFLGWFILFSCTGNQMATVLGVRASASPPSGRSGPTEEEDHGSRIDTMPSKVALRLFRRKPPRLLMGQRRDSLASEAHAGALRPVQNTRTVTAPSSEHAMRNGIGAPLRC